MISNKPVAFRLITVRLYYCFFRLLSRPQPNSIKIGDSVLLIKSGSGVNIREPRRPRRHRQRKRHLKINTWEILPFFLLIFTLPFGRLRQRIVLKYVLHVQHDYFSSFKQSDYCFLASPLLLPSS